MNLRNSFLELKIKGEGTIKIISVVGEYGE